MAAATRSASASKRSLGVRTVPSWKTSAPAKRYEGALDRKSDAIVARVSP
jgi:hypothetical protein